MRPTSKQKSALRWLPSLMLLPCVLYAKDAPYDMGSKRELMVDTHFISRMEGVELNMHKPKAQDVALVCDAPWEGNTSGYFTLFQDGDLYRAYYRGSHHPEDEGKPGDVLATKGVEILSRFAKDGNSQ